MHSSPTYIWSRSTLIKPGTYFSHYYYNYLFKKHEMKDFSVELRIHAAVCSFVDFDSLDSTYSHTVLITLFHFTSGVNALSY